MRIAAKSPRRKTTAEWRAWRRAVLKLQLIKGKTLSTPSIHGVKWENKMAFHYDRKIAELKLREPVKYEVF